MCVMEKINGGKITESPETVALLITRCLSLFPPVIRLHVRQPQLIVCATHRGTPALSVNTQAFPPQDRCWVRLDSHANICSVVPSQSREPAGLDKQGMNSWARCLILPSFWTPGLGLLNSSMHLPWSASASASAFRNQSSLLVASSQNESTNQKSLDIDTDRLWYGSIFVFGNHQFFLFFLKHMRGWCENWYLETERLPHVFRAPSSIHNCLWGLPRQPGFWPCCLLVQELCPVAWQEAWPSQGPWGQPAVVVDFFLST